MLGFGAIGENAIGAAGRAPQVVRPNVPVLVVSSLIIPEKKTSEGILIKSTAAIWHEIAKKLGADWSLAQQLTPAQWEEMVAGAYERAGYKVVLTPRSGDYGRDVIATTEGIGCVKILGSVKAYAPGHLVGADDVRALVGVLHGDPTASKGIISTTFCASDTERSLHLSLHAYTARTDERNCLARMAKHPRQWLNTLWRNSERAPNVRRTILRNDTAKPSAK